MNVLSCKNLSLEVGLGKDKQVLLKDCNFDTNSGDVLCILGRNGSGKTHLLKTLAGLIKPTTGLVYLQNSVIDDLSRRKIAKILGLITQAHDDPFPINVFDHALAGRHPHLGFLDWEGVHDIELTQQALSRVELDNKQKQNVQTLSGGERKRLAIARVLTQNPDVYLWDEPTNHLDPAHQQQTTDLILDLKSQNKTQVIALHDVNHAARIATHILYLMDDGQWCFGTAEKMLSLEALEAVYDTSFKIFEQAGQRYFVM